MTRVVLKPAREASVLRGHPWIFSGALASEPDGVRPGETVEIVSSRGEPLGWGSYSPHSQIRVRLLSSAGAGRPDDASMAARVSASVARRAAYFASGETTGVRLVNAEADGLPGVVADFYAGWVVCQFTSAGAERWKETLADALMAAAPGCLGVSERRDVDARAKEGLAVEPAFATLRGGEPPALVEISEGPCRYLVDVRRGHKTGFYLDQRDARRLVGAHARGAEVLNCFCYTGGFGVSALASGAAHVTQVDVSADALALARRHAALLPGGEGAADHVEGDVFAYLRRCRDAGRSFDLVVLDPPKFAASKAHVEKAARGYKDINLLGMKLLRPGGVLATFSCSGAMTAPFFDQILAEAAADARVDCQILARTQAGSDHPVSLRFPEGAYLKGVFLRRC